MTNDKISLNTHSDCDFSNQINDFINESVRTEKVHYGKVIMFRAICPNCDEILFGNDLHFKCDGCSVEFKGKIDSLRIEVTSPTRKTPSKKIKKQILDHQDEKCFWCERDFGIIYFRYNSIKKLLPNWDHLIPYSYSYSNADENFVASCSICNSFKSSKVFENINECKIYLNKRWNKNLYSRKIIFLEDDSFQIEKNCKKNLLGDV